MRWWTSPSCPPPLLPLNARWWNLTKWWFEILRNYDDYKSYKMMIRNLTRWWWFEILWNDDDSKSYEMMMIRNLMKWWWFEILWNDDDSKSYEMMMIWNLTKWGWFEILRNEDDLKSYEMMMIWNLTKWWWFEILRNDDSHNRGQLPSNDNGPPTTKRPSLRLSPPPGGPTSYFHPLWSEGSPIHY